jgi:hypothetical protein
LAELFKEGYGSRRAVLPMMMVKCTHIPAKELLDIPVK